jgi:hypothetical protein
MSKDLVLAFLWIRCNWLASLLHLTSLAPPLPLSPLPSRTAPLPPTLTVSQVQVPITTHAALLATLVLITLALPVSDGLLNGPKSTSLVVWHIVSNLTPSSFSAL